MLMFLYSVIPSWPLVLMFIGAGSRVLLFPLQAFAFRQQVRLAGVQPRLAKLRKAHSAGADARRLFVESPRVKRESGAREGWLLVSTLAQVPVFIWLFKIIRGHGVLTAVSLAWIPSLAHPDPFSILPLVAAC